MKIEDIPENQLEDVLTRLGAVDPKDWESIALALRVVSADLEAVALCPDPRERLKILLAAEEHFKVAVGPLMERLESLGGA